MADATRTYVERLEELVWQYIEVMEDYSAGFPITREDHPHHEDWVEARNLFGLELVEGSGKKVVT